MAAELNERQRRLWAASEARSAGWGGIVATARATGMAVDTIRKGIAELEAGERLERGRVRRRGAGRKSLVESDPKILEDIERLVDADSRGDPESLLRWTAKSVRQIAGGLREMGHEAHFTSVAMLLRALGYSLQANVKTREGASHPDRDAQFAHINQTARAAVAAGWPVISVDTKKKELVGDFKNQGREWRLKGKPELVRVHDFKDKQLGKAIPYGVYDLRLDEGYVNVGIDHDTAQFAVASIRSWWEHLGAARYPAATSLTITADCGGSNGYRTRLWKTELQRLADETGLAISVCHFPPGTSKWNKIEHRLFAFISQNWRGKPLVSHAVILNLIAATTTTTGLTVESYLDTDPYPAGQKVDDAQMATLRLTRDPFHGEWNYTIVPRGQADENVIP